MERRRTFSREFKLEAIKLVAERGAPRYAASAGGAMEASRAAASTACS